MPYVSRFGTKDQIEKFIPRMTSGEIIGAIAMTEPAAGRSDLTFSCNGLFLTSLPMPPSLVQKNRGIWAEVWVLYSKAQQSKHATNVVNT